MTEDEKVLRLALHAARVALQGCIEQMGQATMLLNDPEFKSALDTAGAVLDQTSRESLAAQSGQQSRTDFS